MHRPRLQHATKNGFAPAPEGGGKRRGGAGASTGEGVNNEYHLAKKTEEKLHLTK